MAKKPKKPEREPLPEIVEVAISGYKNLHRLIVDWSPKTVLYGMNGTGKSNLFEALTILFGGEDLSPGLLERAEPVDEKTTISAVVASDNRELPHPPWFADPVSGGDSGLGGRSANFWLHCDVAEGESWNDAWESSTLDRSLVALLQAQENQPFVRYELRSISGLDVYEDIERSYERTLMVSAKHRALLLECANAGLPDSFRPLLSFLDEPPSSSKYIPVLSLPESIVGPPVEVLWASGGWSNDDLTQFVAASSRGLLASFKEFESAMKAWLNERGDTFEADEWLVKYHASYTLESLAIDVVDHHRIVDELLSYVGEPALHRLSSGEKSWTEFGFAVYAVVAKHLAQRVTQIAACVSRTDTDRFAQSLNQLVKNKPGLEDELKITENHWLNDSVLLLIDLAEKAADDHKSFSEIVAQNVPAESQRHILEATRSLDVPPRGIQILFDEPERNLHPSAQRSAAEKLDQLTDADVAIATHSHYFLGRPGWTHNYLFKPPRDGTVAKTFDFGDLDAASDIVAAMGLSHGELLTRVRLALIVEGRAEVEILDRLYRHALRDAGVYVFSLSGTNEAASLAELEIFGNLLDCKVGLLTDNTRVNVVKKGDLKGASKEESSLIRLSSLLAASGRNPIGFYGLKLPDISCYLADESTRNVVGPGFPGWETLIDESEGRGAPGKYVKDAFKRTTGLDLNLDRIRKIAAQMANDDLLLTHEFGSVFGRIVKDAVEYNK